MLRTARFLTVEFPPGCSVCGQGRGKGATVFKTSCDLTPSLTFSHITLLFLTDWPSAVPPNQPVSCGVHLVK